MLEEEDLSEDDEILLEEEDLSEDDEILLEEEDLSEDDEILLEEDEILLEDESTLDDDFDALLLSLFEVEEDLSEEEESCGGSRKSVSSRSKVKPPVRSSCVILRYGERLRTFLK